MFCSRCGKGDQQAETYCRNCGEFLIDVSTGASLVNRIFGISNPEKQLNLTLTIDLITAIVSGFLLFSLMGYFDATEQRTGMPTSRLVYVLYMFLGLVAVWQLFSFSVGASFRRKLKAGRREQLSNEARQSLPPANQEPIVAGTITEETTRKLKVERPD